MNEFARILRKNPTDAERLLWSKIRRRQLGDFKFRRQRPIGPYICDFVCVEARVIIELDGTFVLPLRRGLPRHLPRLTVFGPGTW
jgi:very-short-patch-repair endonuclease